MKIEATGVSLSLSNCPSNPVWMRKIANGLTSICPVISTRSQANVIPAFNKMINKLSIVQTISVTLVRNQILFKWWKSRLDKQQKNVCLWFVNYNELWKVTDSFMVHVSSWTVTQILSSYGYGI